MQEEMITLYHLRDWYGNVKQKRNNKTQSAIQQSVNQEATDAQCGNKGSPQPGASFLRQLTIHSSLQHAIKRVQRPGETLEASDGKKSSPQERQWSKRNVTGFLREVTST